MSESYDSTEDTKDHINKVRQYLIQASDIIDHRAAIHDKSKLVSPEKEVFDVVTPRLASLTYGSDEYKASLAAMGTALDHHYANNSHHPQHFRNGIDGMSLFDVLEMLMDWKAASERHNDGSISRSLEQNQERFAISDQLQSILANTAREMGW